MQLDDKQWKALEAADATAKFMAGKRTGNRSIDAVTERIARLARERAEREGR